MKNFFCKKSIRILLIIHAIVFATTIIICGFDKYILKELLICVLGVDLLMAVVALGVLYIKQGYRGLEQCQDELFDEIDLFKKTDKEDDDFFKYNIQIINYYYIESGEVDELVKTQSLQRLYQRQSYLNNQIGLYEHATGILMALTVSLAASLLYGFIEEKKLFIFSIIVRMVAIVLSLAVILLYRYREKGEYGSFKSNLYKYELKLLNKRISQVESELRLSEHEKQLICKQVEEKRIIAEQRKKLWPRIKESIDRVIKAIMGKRGVTLKDSDAGSMSADGIQNSINNEVIEENNYLEDIISNTLDDYKKRIEPKN